MSNTNTGGPAFPNPELGVYHFGDPGVYQGLSKREYAAIHLKVPDSGTDWLDDMIRKAKRDEFAAKAMQGAIASSSDELDFGPELGSAWSYQVADAMLKASEA